MKVCTEKMDRYDLYLVRGSAEGCMLIGCDCLTGKRFVSVQLLLNETFLIHCSRNWFPFSTFASGIFFSLQIN